MPITSAQAQEARQNITSVALHTPLIRCNADMPANLYLKLENLQPIGSFKIRGAANVMARTPKELLTRGVLTASAGNMAQGVAFCAQRIGVCATIIAPDTAPATKIRAVERMGGRVIKVPFAEWWRTFETRSYPGIDATFIHAFDDPDVMAGNGTIALELLEDLPDLDAVVIPWGGGGLSCGIAGVLRELAPRVRIYAAEIETAAPLAASLAAGEPRPVEYRPSFVDGIGSKMVFPGMFESATQTTGWIAGGHSDGSGTGYESGGRAEPDHHRRCCSLCGRGRSVGPSRLRQDRSHRVWRQHRPGQVRSTGRLIPFLHPQQFAEALSQAARVSGEPSTGIKRMPLLYATCRSDLPASDSPLRARSADSGPLPRTIRTSVMAKASRWNSKPSPFCCPDQFINDPFYACTIYAP